jgi:hypothetical protein
MMQSRFLMHHICTGRNLVCVPDEPDLVGSPDLWAALWDRHREQLLAEWVRESPGSRPPAFWRWDHGMEPPEDEREYLAAHGMLTRVDLDGIRRKALELLRHNRGRTPSRPGDNYIPDRDGLVSFARSQGLLTPEPERDGQHDTPPKRETGHALAGRG